MTLKAKIENLNIHHALEIYEIMQLVLKRENKLNKGKEHFWVIALDTAHKIISLELISTGGLTSTTAKPMEVISVPLQKGAFGVMLVHNYPSGRLEPSEADKDLTDYLIQVCKLMNTPVLDHLIITENSYYSFKASGLLAHLEASKRYALPYELERQSHEETQEAIKIVEQESLKIEEEKRIREGTIKIAKEVLQEGLDPKLVAHLTGMSLQQIKQLTK
jgi:DNA repair protein RadC